MRALLAAGSLRTQLVALAVSCVLLAAVGALLLTAGAAHPSAARILVGACTGGAVGVALAAWLAGRLRRPLSGLRDMLTRLIDGDLSSDGSPAMPNRELLEVKLASDRLVEQLRVARADQERFRTTLADRTKTVDCLLDFSQTIGGAGKPDQVFPTLTHFLQSELSLSAIVILGHEPEAVPAVQTLGCWPAGLTEPERPVAELDAALCPCLRQAQPRQFRPEGSPVRCTIEQCFSLAPAAPAYCIPFNIGRKTQVVVHMLLAGDQKWTQERQQLAQTYVNTAQSALVSLHLLAEAEKQSMTDVLTGLYNRRSMDQLLQREVALAERHAWPLSVVMIDVDHFKQVNDAHGHAAGDHLLRTFADCVRITLRRTDLAFRYGGDEFVIALPQAPIAQAEQVVNKLRQAFAAVDFSSAIAHLDEHPTLSIGVAERSVGQNVLSLASLLSAADQALYDAKSSSRNCVKIYEPPKAA